MTADEIRAGLDRTPGATRFLQRVARHAAKGCPLPPRIVLGLIPGDKPTEALLGMILSNRCFPERGKYILKLPAEMRDPGYWVPLVEALGGAGTPDASHRAADPAAETVKRLKLIYPGERELIAGLDETGAIRRFVGTDSAKAAQYLKIFAAYASLGDRGSTTLSQLGSLAFNDSKALRSGALLGQLDKILRLARDQPAMPASELRANCGIIDNPYTSHVVVFAPFAFVTNDGQAYDYPRRLFRAGQAAVLPWETVRRIDAIQIELPLQLVTSENAAPFLDLVGAARPALYTGGYPSTTIQTLLGHFGRAGASALHFGDTDLDGYRIAEQVSRLIAFDGLYTDGRGADLPRKPLTAPQRARLEAYIARHPGFRFIDELRDTLAHGWIEQEAFGALGAGKVP